MFGIKLNKITMTYCNSDKLVAIQIS